MTPRPPFTRFSSSRMGNGFQMSKSRKSAKATADSRRLAEASAASGRNATISSHTTAPWSAAPRSRPVTSHAHTPTKKSGIATNATASGGRKSSSAQQIGKATSVPKVPGAQGTRPLPNPRAMKCAGWPKRNRASGAREMVESAPIDLHRLAVGAEQAHALAALHLPDARERNVEHVGKLGDAVARIRGRREKQLVVVSAGDDRGGPRVARGVLRADHRDRDLRELDRGAQVREPADVPETGEGAGGKVDSAGRHAAQGLAKRRPGRGAVKAQHAPRACGV